MHRKYMIYKLAGTFLERLYRVNHKCSVISFNQFTRAQDKLQILVHVYLMFFSCYTFVARWDLFGFE